MNPRESTPSPSLVRLNKYLADQGIASRRKCDELIAAGKVSIDDLPVTQLGTKVDPHTQRVEVDGVVLKPERAERRYYLLNKPAGVVCTNEERETRARAIDLIDDRRKGRIYTVGRLDEDSEGLILLTNDGEFAQRIAHPRHGVTKTYRISVRGRIAIEAVQRIRGGVHLAEGRTQEIRVRIDRRTATHSNLTVTMREGLNREVRRIFARVGYEVVSLRRVRIGSLTDPKLRRGQWRVLRQAEIRALLEEAGAEEGRGARPPRRNRAARGGRPATPARRSGGRDRQSGGRPRRSRRGR